MTGVEDEQLIERFFDAIARLDMDAAAALVADDYEGYAVDEMPIRGELEIYRGKAGLRTWMGEVTTGWQSFNVNLARIRRHRDVHVAIGVYEAERGRSAFGESFHQFPFVCVIRVHDGVIGMIHSYPTLAAAAGAEGIPISEPDLELRD